MYGNKTTKYIGTSILLAATFQKVSRFLRILEQVRRSFTMQFSDKGRQLLIQ